MALTVNTRPAEFQPVWHPMMYLVSTSLTGLINFKFKFVITVGSTVRTILVSPRPGGQGEFDISKHLQEFLNTDDFILPTTDTFTEAPIVQYQVAITEQWFDGLANVDGATVVEATSYASDVVLDRPEILNFDEEFYRLDEDGSLPIVSKLLFNTEEMDYVYKDDYYYIHAVGIPDSPTVGATIREYDSSGTQVAITTIAGVTGLNTSGAKYLKLDMATIAWNAATTEITIAMTNSSVIATTVKRFKLTNSQCSSFDSHRFFYKDKLGSMNMIDLDQPSYGNLSIKPKTFNHRVDPLVENGRSKGVTRYTQSAEETFTANTRALRADQIYKIEDLLLSNLVYLDVRAEAEWGTVDFIPVEILTKKMEYYKRGNQDIPQYTIEFKHSFDKVTRR